MDAMSLSLISVSMAGQVPKAVMAVTAMEENIIMLINGMQSRLVRRKYCGKVPNLHHAIGPVNS